MASRPASVSTDRIADRIRLHRQVDSRPVIVVEGKSDQRFVGRVISADLIVTFIAGTRSAVIAAAADVAAMRLHRVACVVDRDFDDLVALAESAHLPIAPYDGADLEGMLWSTPALDDLIQELGSTDKLATFGGVETLRSAVDEALRPVCRLRRANALNGWGLNFDEHLALERRVNVRTLTLSRQSLCDSLWRDDLGIGKAVLYGTAQQGEDALCPSTGQNLIRGKDALAVAGVGLRRRIGNLGQRETTSARLAESLRLCTTASAVERTQWREKLRGLLGI